MTTTDHTDTNSADSADSTGIDSAAKSAGGEVSAVAKPSSRPSLRDQLASGSWKPGRISGEDLARMLASRRRGSGATHMSPRGPEAGGHRRIGRGLFGTGLVILALAATTEMSHSTNTERREANTAQISALEVSLAQARRAPQRTARAEALAQLVEEATKAADAVAVGQQRYAELAYTANPATSTTDAGSTGGTGRGTRGDGVPGSSVLAMVAQRRALARYWRMDSLLVDPEAAYVFDTVDPFGPGQIDPRWPWYLHYTRHGAGPGDGEIRAADPASYAWTRFSIAPTTGRSEPAGRAPRLVQVAWVCRETTTGHVLAWARADYEASSGHFDDLYLTTTSYATRPTTHTAPAPPAASGSDGGQGGREIKP